MIRGPHHRLPWIAAFCLGASVAASTQSSVPAIVARAPVTWLIVVDDLHLDFRNTGRIRDAIRTMAAELILEGDRFAMVSTGPSALTIDVTGDRQLLDAAIKRTTGNALKYEDVVASPYGPVEARYRASIAVASAQELLNNLSREPAERMALLYVSNGYSVDILPDRLSTSPRLGQGRDYTRAEIREQLAQLTASAARASIKIFAIKPRMGDPIPVPTDPGWTAHLSAMRSVLQSISDGSGGFAVVDGDFVTQLRQVANTMRR
jgi:hypothetical protein